MDDFAVYASMKAQKGKEKEVEEFLKELEALAMAETGTKGFERLLITGVERGLALLGHIVVTAPVAVALTLSGVKGRSWALMTGDLISFNTLC